LKDFEAFEAVEHMRWILKDSNRNHTREERRRRRSFRYKAGAAALVVLFLLMAFIIGFTACAMTSKEPYTTPAETTIVYSEPLYLPEREPVEEEVQTYSLVIENSTVSHYCICKKCCGKDESHPAYGITASGREAEPYVSIAVDPALIELGSIVRLDFGNGEVLECRADDTGSAIAGSKIDLCVSSHEEALQLGLRTATVYVQEVA
jgi:3D (Asp-Asp-Asp) domain-containing protein